MGKLDGRIAVVTGAASGIGKGSPSPLAATVDRIATTLDFTGLNCLLMTPDRRYAVSRFGPNQDELTVRRETLEVSVVSLQDVLIPS